MNPFLEAAECIAVLAIVLAPVFLRYHFAQRRAQRVQAPATPIQAIQIHPASGRDPYDSGPLVAAPAEKELM